MEAITTSIEILDYSPEYKDDFKRLNMEWMAQFKGDIAHKLFVDDPEAGGAG